MRTLADGLETLRDLQTDLGDHPISVRTQPMRLPTGELTAIVVLLDPETTDDPRWAVALPSSAQFIATTTQGARQRYDIARLDGATVDVDGNVCLTNGVHLHNVELLPTTLRPELTKRQERILYLTIFVLHAQDRCFRAVHPSLPDLVGVDYGALPKEKLPSLKELERRITRKMPDATRHEIANALAVAGMRQPRSRRRANRPTPISAP